MARPASAGPSRHSALFSGVFLVLLLWLGTRVLADRLSIGQLISFLGYGLYLIGPIRTFFEFAQKITVGQRPQGDHDLRTRAAVA